MTSAVAGRPSLRTAVRWGVGHALPGTALRGLGRRGDPQGRILTAADDDDLRRLFEELRTRGPVAEGRLSSVAVAHPVVRQVLASPDFTIAFDRRRLPAPLTRLADWAAVGSPIGPLDAPSLLAVDPPDHTRYRKLVTGVFTGRAVQRLRERAVRVADDLLDGLEGRNEVDLVAEYCTLLPVTMIAEILGVPADERDAVLQFGERAAPSLDLGLGWRRFLEVESSLHAFEAWLEHHISRLRAHPTADLLSELAAARDEGQGLTDTELKATAGLVLAAGFETTVNLLSNAVDLLLRHPDQLAGLRGADTAAWVNVADETLRVDPPVLLTGRTAVRDTTVAGRTVPAGRMVMTVLAAANRDPDVFDHPASFDVTRANASDHTSFSYGRHHCLGAALARMEGEVGLSRLFDRFPDMRLLPGARRRDTRILRGFQTLPVRVT